MSTLVENLYPLAMAALCAGLVFLATVSSWIVYSATCVNHRRPLPPAISNVERVGFTSPKAGPLSYYVAKGVGKPLVLIHSINAGASSYEMRPIFEHYQGKRPVYALDLPGFGFSERSDRVYTARLYTDAIKDFLATQVPEAADVVALSLGSEFAARAAQEQPNSFLSLAMISPTGFGVCARKPPRPQLHRDKSVDRRSHGWLSFPLWAQALYDLLVTKVSIDYFLGLCFNGTVNKDLANYDFLTTHQPGARFAPLYFVSGKLFSSDIRTTVYAQLGLLPVLVLYDIDSFVRFDLLAEHLRMQASWRAVRIYPSKGLPQFERMGDTAEALDDFWNDDQ